MGGDVAVFARQDEGAEAFKKRFPERRIKSLAARAKELGMNLSRERRTQIRGRSHRPAPVRISAGNRTSPKLNFVIQDQTNHRFRTRHARRPFGYKLLLTLAADWAVRQ